MKVKAENIAFIAKEIQSGKACWVSVFSKTGFEVGYSVKPRFRAFNLKTSKYDGEWVEPKDEIIRFLDDHKVCASLYNKQTFEQLIRESGLASTADYFDCLRHYLAEIDTDLKSCLEEVGKPVLPWTKFVEAAPVRRRLIISNS